MILVPADFAQAQTCPTGETATTISGTCVKDNDGTSNRPLTSLQVANACEAAGWGLNQNASGCLIKLHDFGEDGGPLDFCGLSTGCEYFFADALMFPTVLMSLTAETDTRRFVAYCTGGEEPSGANDAGQVQCCAPPMIDDDMNPDTPCVAPPVVAACEVNEGGCPTNSFCQEKQGGGVECVCDGGWRGGSTGSNPFAPDSGTVCANSNECDILGNCGDIGSCTDTAGSYICTCPSGYQKAPGLPDTAPCNLSDNINECTTTDPQLRHNCVNGTCKDESGNFKCICNAGWTGDACDADIDECTLGTDDCAPDDEATCTNTDGGFTCECKNGYSGDGKECFPDRTVRISLAVNGTLSAKAADGTEVQDGDMIAHGTTITFFAAPEAGYYVSEWTGCPQTNFNIGSDNDARDKECWTTATSDLNVAALFSDRNECEVAAFLEECKANSFCRDTEGSFECLCNRGYAGDGKAACVLQLRKLEVIVPPGFPEGAEFQARPEADCYVREWTGTACAGSDTGSSSDPGKGKSCALSGTGTATVGVVFACD